MERRDIQRSSLLNGVLIASVTLAIALLGSAAVRWTGPATADGPGAVGRRFIVRAGRRNYEVVDTRNFERLVIHENRSKRMAGAVADALNRQARRPPGARPGT